MSRLESLKIKAKLLQKSKRRSGKSIKLKEAYNIIAKSSGFNSWRAMKSCVEEYAIFRPPGRGLPYWNSWYSSYEEAKRYLNRNTQYLLPYEKQFFLCEVDYIEALGIDKKDPDLQLVGADWVCPKDLRAFERIKQKVADKGQSKVKLVLRDPLE